MTKLENVRFYVHGLLDTAPFVLPMDLVGEFPINEAAAAWILRILVHQGELD